MHLISKFIKTLCQSRKRFSRSIMPTVLLKLRIKNTLKIIKNKAEAKHVHCTNTTALKMLQKYLWKNIFTNTYTFTLLCHLGQNKNGKRNSKTVSSYCEASVQ